MNISDLIVAKLDAMHKPIVVTGTNYITTTCLNPNHQDKHPSFWINTSPGAGGCFSCGFKIKKDYWVDGSLDEEKIEELLRDSLYSNLLKKFDKNEEEQHQPIYLPPKDEEIDDGWRGLSTETIQRLDLYICRTGMYRDRVIFPYRDYQDNIVGFNTRALLPNMMPKYKYSKHLPIKDLIYPKVYQTDHIVLVEGIMDAISMQQDGIPAIMNFGVNVAFSSKKVKTLYAQGVETIYIAFDNDEAGVEGIKKYFDSWVSDFFELKVGMEHPKLKPFYLSKCKDYNDFITSQKS